MVTLCSFYYICLAFIRYLLTKIATNTDMGNIITMPFSRRWNRFVYWSRLDWGGRKSWAETWASRPGFSVPLSWTALCQMGGPATIQALRGLVLVTHFIPGPSLPSARTHRPLGLEQTRHSGAVAGSGDQSPPAAGPPCSHHQHQLSVTLNICWVMLSPNSC